ncbi:MAG: hypothetical protein KBD16_00635 [Candidatus Pacebacteria bacterium]|nr:hypothetical protein [Candidatus Paceibacterota bacterium]
MSELNKSDDIFGYITQMESDYKRPIPVGNKEWSMRDHIERSTLYKYSDIVGAKTKFTPIKNLTLPILNLQARTEDIDVKDVQIYVDDKEKYHLSFLVKKYHDDVFVRQNDLDTFFDRLNQSRIDYGGGLSKRLAQGREVVPLQSIVFCDQTDILSGPIGIKHYYSPDQLMEMGKVGWGEKANGATTTLKEIVRLSREEKKDNNTEGAKASTPGRYIEVYEVHGNLPKRYADPTDDSEEYETRLFIVAFYQKGSGNGQTGVILYTAPETDNPFKLAQRGVGMFGRALDFGGAEELFEDQLWTNYAEIRKIQLLDSASKTLLGASGPSSSTIAQRNNINDLENNEILDLGPEGELKQIDTFPRNFRLFDNYSAEKQEHAKYIGAALDPLQGSESPSGTPFASLQAQIQQGMGLHDYRRGIFAKHIEEIYNDDYIPQITKEITKGMTFLSELSVEELQYVTNAVVTCELEKAKKEFILNNMGTAMTPEEEQMLAEKIKAEFQKKGSKHFIEILKGEFKGIALNVKVNVAGKQKNLGKATDAIVNILRFVMTTNSPALGFQGTWELVNRVIEQSGMDPVDFSGLMEGFKKMFEQQQQLAQAQQQSPATPSQGQPAYAG